MNAKDFTVRKADGSEMKLSEIKGPILAVNVASKCGLTPQYEGLEALNREYASRGLTILAFPCNQFMGQEPGTADEIASFCSLTYDVTFPILAKIEVNGNGADPFYKHLKKEQGGMLGASIKWNFTKFLIDREGNVVKRYGPQDTPASIAKDIAKLL